MHYAGQVYMHIGGMLYFNNHLKYFHVLYNINKLYISIIKYDITVENV